MKPRKLTLQDNTFVWNRKHYHAKEVPAPPCVEKLSIFLEGHKHSPLRIEFTSDKNTPYPKWCIDDASGIVFWSSTENDKGVVNLNLPSTVAAFIKYFLQNGWTPQTSKKPFDVKDGMKYLELVFEKTV